MNGHLTASTGPLLTQDQLAAIVPSRFRDKAISAQTIRRWQLKGLHGIFLNYTRVGSIPCSTENDLKAFFDELTRRDQASRFLHVEEPASSPTKASKQAIQRSQVFEKEAKELGL
jgi:hypothetical protein